MALQLPANFKNDIQSRDTNLVPLVVIDWDGNNPLSISTNEIYIAPSHYKPLLLNIPSLKESIDIEK